MTTILAMKKIKTIYCDRQLNVGSKKMTIPAKIFPIKHHDGTKELLAGCGNWDKVKAFVAWYEAKAKHGEVITDEEKPFHVLEPPNIEGASFITITDKGEMWYMVDNGQWAEICDDYMAMGSGGDFATGAIAAGASPKQAMKIAHQFDAMTGSKVMKKKL